MFPYKLCNWIKHNLNVKCIIIQGLKLGFETSNGYGLVTLSALLVLDRNYVPGFS